MKLIKLYGLERTGTNYIKALIETNFNSVVFANLFGGKHLKFWLNQERLENYKLNIIKNIRDKGTLSNAGNTQVATNFTENDIDNFKKNIISNGLSYVIIIKNPYSWLLSYHNYLKNILRTKKGNLNENLIKDYSEHWSNIYGNWYKEIVKQRNFVKGDNGVIIIEYESLVNDLTSNLNKIKDELSLEKKQNNYINITKETHMGGDYTTKSRVNISNNNFNKKKYYTEKKFMSDIGDNKLLVDKYFNFDLYKKLITI